MAFNHTNLSSSDKICVHMHIDLLEVLLFLQKFRDPQPHIVGSQRFA